MCPYNVSVLTDVRVPCLFVRCGVLVEAAGFGTSGEMQCKQFQVWRENTIIKYLQLSCSARCHVVIVGEHPDYLHELLRKSDDLSNFDDLCERPKCLEQEMCSFDFCETLEDFVRWINQTRWYHTSDR